MRSVLKLRNVLLLLVFALVAGACASGDDTAGTTDTAETAVADPAADPAVEATTDDAMTEDAATDVATTEEGMTEEGMTEEGMTEEGMTEEGMTEGATTDAAASSAEICDTEGLVQAVESGPEDGTLAGMSDDPVATAASSNPVLTTLATAVDAAGLVDTLNSAEALTVFAPTDCAFAQLDPATMDAAMADPQGLLTTVLGYHVIAGEQIASADLSGEYTTFTEEMLTVDGTTVGGQAQIVVPDIQTANATVHLIDTVMMPPSMTEAG